MLEPVERLPEGIGKLKVFAPDKTFRRAIKKTKIKNYGKRTAVPPKDKKGEEYGLRQLTPMEDFEYGRYGDGIALTAYKGNALELVLPGEHCGLKKGQTGYDEPATSARLLAARKNQTVPPRRCPDP
ncbi:MAG: hypothetical protein LBK22_09260 [Tannerella sp.]|jgi:hypothetical protein|nr:hypothetical protein [Tannerella sp.]